VDKSFFKTLAKLVASSSGFSLAKSENRPKSKKGSVRGEKDSRQAGDWIFTLLAKLKFYLHLAIWRVVIRTPGMLHTCTIL
jgi:hypothetical protein